MTFKGSYVRESVFFANNFSADVNNIIYICIYMQVQKYLERFVLSLEKLQEVSARLKKDLIRGLGKHSHHRAPVKMLPTFVRATPDGTGRTLHLTSSFISDLYIWLLFCFLLVSLFHHFNCWNFNFHMLLLFN